jgi:hypothetical protein
VGCGILFHIGLKINALCGIGKGALQVFVTFCGIGFFLFWDALSSHYLLHIFAVFLLSFLATLGWITLEVLLDL